MLVDYSNKNGVLKKKQTGNSLFSLWDDFFHGEYGRFLFLSLLFM